MSYYSFHLNKWLLFSTWFQADPIEKWSQHNLFTALELACFLKDRVGAKVTVSISTSIFKNTGLLSLWVFPLLSSWQDTHTHTQSFQGHSRVLLTQQKRWTLKETQASHSDSQVYHGSVHMTTFLNDVCVWNNVFVLNRLKVFLLTSFPRTKTF